MPPGGSSPDHRSVRVQVAGHVFVLDQEGVSRAVSRIEPGEIRDHFVEIRGRRYPVKQALAAATGLDLSDFTSQHARSALRRLGMPVGRLSAHNTTMAVHQDIQDTARLPVQRRAAAVPAAEDPASVLRPYQNRWVALQRNRVLTDQESFADVVAWLRDNGVKADAVFLVPDDPEQLFAGMRG